MTPNVSTAHAPTAAAPTAAPPPRPAVAAVLEFTVTGHTIMLFQREAWPGGPLSRGGTLHGYESPHTFLRQLSGGGYAPDPDREGSGYMFPDGMPIVDTRRAVESAAGYRWAIRGPLCAPDLPPGAVDYCPAPSGSMTLGLAAVGASAYAALLAMQTAHRSGGATATGAAGPLDGVSVPEWVRGWRQHGARTGRLLTTPTGRRFILWDPPYPPGRAPKSEPEPQQLRLPGVEVAAV